MNRAQHCPYRECPMSVTGAAYQEDTFRPLTDGAEAGHLGKISEFMR